MRAPGLLGPAPEKVSKEGMAYGRHTVQVSVPKGFSPEFAVAGSSTFVRSYSTVLSKNRRGRSRSGFCYVVDRIDRLSFWSDGAFIAMALIRERSRAENNVSPYRRRDSSSHWK